FYNFVRAANQQPSVRTSLRFKTRTRQRRPPGLLAAIRHRLRVTREEGVGCLLGGVADIAEHVEADLELIRGMPVLPAGFPVEIDQGPKSLRLAAHDPHPQRESEQ